MRLTRGLSALVPGMESMTDGPFTVAVKPLPDEGTCFKSQQRVLMTGRTRRVKRGQQRGERRGTITGVSKTHQTRSGPGRCGAAGRSTARSPDISTDADPPPPPLPELDTFLRLCVLKKKKKKKKMPSPAFSHPLRSNKKNGICEQLPHAKKTKTNKQTNGQQSARSERTNNTKEIN